MWDGTERSEWADSYSVVLDVYAQLCYVWCFSWVCEMDEFGFEIVSYMF